METKIKSNAISGKKNKHGDDVRHRKEIAIQKAHHNADHNQHIHNRQIQGKLFEAVPQFILFSRYGITFDLNIGYVTGFSAVVSTKAMSLLSETNPDMNPWLIIVLGLLVSCAIGAIFGLLNGIAVAKFHIAPFIITLV